MFAHRISATVGYLSVLLGGVLALTSAVPVSAMTLEVKGDTLFASGPVTDDLKGFEEAFAKNSITTVVLVNSPGGMLWDGLRVGRLIASKNVNTVVAGFCASACSVMFMGGKERRFSDAFHAARTYVGIHGPHNLETKQVDSRQAPDMHAFYKSRIGDAFDSAVMNKALYEMDDAGALLYLYDPTRNSKDRAFHCISSQTFRANCTHFPEKTALSLGVITHADLVKVALPERFKDSNAIWGRTLDEPVVDLDRHLASLGANNCAAPTCANWYNNYSKLEGSKALAVPVGAKGGGNSFNVQSQAVAIIRALYNCNHPARTAPRLCELKFVDNFDVSGLYAEAKEANAKAFATLKVPSEKAYASEQFGGGFTKANGYRTEKFNDITPDSLDGITKVDTQTLAKMLLEKGEAGMSLIDVWGSFATLPGAHALVNGGVALTDPEKEAALEQRFLNMLKLMAPQTDKPIVFFCGSRECWHAVNAAMRARKLGYTNVLWYRGGTKAWTEAGLPTVQGVLRAIVN